VNTQPQMQKPPPSPPVATATAEGGDPKELAERVAALSPQDAKGLLGYLRARLGDFVYGGE
jgi:hypothetical protein